MVEQLRSSESKTYPLIKVGGFPLDYATESSPLVADTEFVESSLSKPQRLGLTRRVGQPLKLHDVDRGRLIGAICSKCNGIVPCRIKNTPLDLDLDPVDPPIC